MPKAEEALRLCYYMRSQGFDSYAVIRDGVISLFLVDARLHANDENSEHLYWMQHVKTNLITYMAPSSSGGGGGGVMRAGVARRNALAANDRRLIPTATGELRYYSGLEAPLGHMRGGAGGPADGQENGMHAGAEGRGATASAAGGARQPETVDVIAQLRARISALDRLLENPVQDPDAVAAVLLEIGELEGQMGRA
ncbi:uncharacterized protein K460DRAFT_367809 [Cucurbitaria berberidis CBS 394.84]|uniref:Uncharacterized protein n=1 Tax=Cucurbitaria berberidis CBS 394.84 TaxID=1168544 RepID=A0A9P4GC96_9PLEO|nr:uncharacterized protein K460DRAFT_367809 [Cucurbitaria berberidis CBS 394.84]KAF1842864.1 hypothetical protein K460DRAFT_367809 [Cucurbitaria berberidis CBS 394.84]